MRACYWLLATTLLLVSCNDSTELEQEPIEKDASSATTGTQADAATSGESGSDASAPSNVADAASSANDAGSAMDAALQVDAAAADASVSSDAALDAASAADGANAAPDGALGGAAIATLNAPCNTALEKACTGHNSADKLVCLDGKWSHNGSCDLDSRCETAKGASQGLCVAVAAGCAGKMPDASVCDGVTIQSCGPDLTVRKELEKCGANAHCAAEGAAMPRCVCDTGFALNLLLDCVNPDNCRGTSNPCGQGNVCVDGNNDFTCTCGGDSWMGATAKSCISRFQHVSVGDGRSCAVRRDRSVACWGNGMQGTNNRPQTVSGVNNVSQLSVGRNHACALSNGNVSCWGENSEGQLGNNSTNSANAPVGVAGLNGVQQISAGNNFTCARRNSANGNVRCWGDNAEGQLGNNSVADARAPVTVGGDNNNFASVAAGTEHACARRANGQVACWGNNDHGELTGTMADVRLPLSLTEGVLGSGVDELVAGLNFSCARKGGNVWCWGAGLGGAAMSTMPVQVEGLSDATQISAGASGTHVCALKRGGTVVCWGENGSGQLGNDSSSDSDRPVTVSSLNGVTEIAAGTSHSCAVKSDGEIWCWGEGSNGALGTGMNNDSDVPVQVAH